MDRCGFEGDIYTFGDVTGKIAFEVLVIFFAGWDIFAVNDTNSIKGYYCSRDVNLLDGIKNVLMYIVSINYRISLFWANFEGINGDKLVIYEYCGGHVSDSARTNRNFDGTVFNTIWRLDGGGLRACS